VSERDEERKKNILRLSKKFTSSFSSSITSYLYFLPPRTLNIPSLYLYIERELQTLSSSSSLPPPPLYPRYHFVIHALSESFFIIDVHLSQSREAIIYDTPAIILIVEIFSLLFIFITRLDISLTISIEINVIVNVAI
jgi:hypothetical protein